MNLPARDLKHGDPPPLALHDRAMDNLRYIRETMERSASFTHVSGIGGVAMGCVALVAAATTLSVDSRLAWLAVWLGAAVVSLCAATYATARKSQAAGQSLMSGPGRRFIWNVIPPLVAGAVLTAVFVRAGLYDLLPGTWLLLYGTSIVTGGSYSVRPIPLLGAAFMLAGVVALLTPAAWGDYLMAAGFGGLHIGFGTLIWRKHGG